MGQGSTSDVTYQSPVKIDLGGPVEKVGSSDEYEFAIAMMKDGTVKHWGRGYYYSCGQSSCSDRGKSSNQMGSNIPIIDIGTGRTAIDLAVSRKMVGVVLDDGTVKVWGSSSYEQNGQPGGSTYTTKTPTLVDLGTNVKVKKIFGDGRDGYRFCVITDDDRVKCWGYCSYNACGYDDTTNRGNGADDMGDNLPYLDFGGKKSGRLINVGDLNGCLIRR
jgi:alpha-tubulin suppressor-like RCC1 family protein